MSKFAVGDRVAVSGFAQDFKDGRIHDLEDERGLYTNDVMTPHMSTIRIHLDCGLQVNVHPKQCRKLGVYRCEEHKEDAVPHGTSVFINNSKCHRCALIKKPRRRIWVFYENNTPLGTPYTTPNNAKNWERGSLVEFVEVKRK